MAHEDIIVRCNAVPTVLSTIYEVPEPLTLALRSSYVPITRTDSRALSTPSFDNMEAIVELSEPSSTQKSLHTARSSSSTAKGTWYDDKDDVSIAESAMPSPLRLERRVADPHHQELASPRPPIRVYGGAASKLHDHLGVDIETTYYNRPPSGLQRPPRSRRSSNRRFSLTPSVMPYPVGLLSSPDPEDFTKAEQMLGLRRQSRPPPVPPKNTSTSASSKGQCPTCNSQTSINTLPKYETVPTDKSAEPLNGRKAWLHAFAAVLIVFNCWGVSNAFGLFQAYYELDLLKGASPSAISWIGSTQLALVFGLGVPVGRLVDKGYFRLMFHTGSVVMVLGLFATAWCHELWSLWLVQGLVTGTGMGMVFCSGIVALMTWFDETKIGVAMSLGAAGSCVGGIVYVLVARHLLVTRGFPTTMRVLGGLAAATMIPPNLIFCMRNQKHKSLRPGAKGSRTTPNNSPITWRSFTTPSYLLAASGMFFAFLGVYFGFVYMISYASTVLHLSHTGSTNLLIFMLAANLPGRFLPALISDRCIGPLNTIIPSIFLSAAVIGLWLASEHNQGTLMVIACFYGFVSAGIQVLYAPTVYTFCLEPAAGGETKSSSETKLATDRMGLKAGVIQTSIGLACLIGTPIGGALISYRTERKMGSPYLGAQIFAGLSLLLGGCLLLASRVAKIGWQPRRA